MRREKTDLEGMVSVGGEDEREGIECTPKKIGGSEGVYTRALGTLTSTDVIQDYNQTGRHGRMVMYVG